MKKLTPIDLQAKSTPIDVTGKYNWEKQAYEYDVCKWGTRNSTSNQTCSGQYNMIDDHPMDSWSD